MQHFDAQAVAHALPYPGLMQALTEGLVQPITVPARGHYAPNGDDSCVLIMPAWRSSQVMGVKLVSVWPDNHTRGLPAVSGVYVLIDAQTGRPLAVMDGTELTLRRTAAAAALAAQRLARADSRRLLVAGTGALSAPLALAHASALELEDIMVWGRRPEQTEQVVRQLREQGLAARAMAHLNDGLARADVVAVATTATQAFIANDAVRPGTHLGLVGAFTRQMAEAEPALMPRARIFADQRAAVLDKGGEVYQAIEQGLIEPQAIVADLTEMLGQSRTAWRRGADEITVYKSVGFASLDLIAAERVMAQAHQTGTV
ncbi:MAG: ornithine cyclodeaminase family protein [Alphaproteobacteria bacterium]|nr:ornithine cyclodeaminase family protein [Alphaproteobacteria bacterium]